MTLELGLEALVAILLAVTVVYCIILNRRLAGLRGSQDEMMAMMGEFTKATRQAEASVGELKAASSTAGAELQRKVETARALRDELSVMTQSGDDLASRLERAASGRRRTGREDDIGETVGAGDRGRSESERELLEALKHGR